jgi:hypothetical protein
MKLSTGTWLWLLEVGVKGSRSYVGFPGVYLTPRSCLYALSNRTKVSGSRGTPRGKTCVTGAGRAANANVTDFLGVGMKSVQVTYDFLELCDSWAAHMFAGSLFEVLTAAKVDGYLCRAHRQPSPVFYIKPLRILLQCWPISTG